MEKRKFIGFSKVQYTIKDEPNPVVSIKMYVMEPFNFSGHASLLDSKGMGCSEHKVANNPDLLAKLKSLPIGQDIDFYFDDKGKVVYIV